MRWEKRSTKFLRTQLALRREVERLRLQALGGEPSPETDPFDVRLRRRALEVIAEHERELASRRDAS